MLIFILICVKIILHRVFWQKVLNLAYLILYTSLQERPVKENFENDCHFDNWDFSEAGHSTSRPIPVGGFERKLLWTTAPLFQNLPLWIFILLEPMMADNHSLVSFAYNSDFVGCLLPSKDFIIHNLSIHMQTDQFKMTAS